MTLRSGFFNSINGDRKYDARWFAKYFASFIGNGVFPNPSSGFQVVERENMSISVRAGQAWILGYFADNDSDYIFELGNADGVLKRIDRVVLRLNFNTRQIELAVKKGAFSSAPIAPALQRDADIYELGIADIYINNGATQITQANITDTRFNAQLCGIVKGVVDQIDATNLFAQYNAAFEEWFSTIQGILDGDIAANLAAQILNVKAEVNTHSDDYTEHIPFVKATSSDGVTYSAILDGVTEYTLGMAISIQIDKTTTSDRIFLSINGLPPQPIAHASKNLPIVGGLLFDSVYTLRYSGDRFVMQGDGFGLLNSITSASNLHAATANAVKMVNDKIEGAWYSGTPTSPFSSNVMYKKTGGVVTVTAQLSYSGSISTGIEYQFFTLPIGYRPKFLSVGVGLFTNNQVALQSIGILTNGQMILRPNVNGTSGNLLCFAVTFQTEN